MHNRNSMQIERYHPDGEQPPASAGWIWVFGSNLAGRHGAGAALVGATTFGSERGVGQGRTGQSYAIPTKDEKLSVLPFESIRDSVAEFLLYAAEHPELQFFVTRVGCGLAGYKDARIAPLFAPSPLNCSLPKNWAPFLEPRLPSGRHRPTGL
ncbi:MAG: hypothetical protein Q7V53_02805 [Caldisericota bacterium]|nr:hypothetical protein [Caldisericota bacterium]